MYYDWSIMCDQKHLLSGRCLISLSATYNLQQTTIVNFAAFSKITNKAWYFMRIVCWQQMILMKYHTLFCRKLGKIFAKFVVCCSWNWRFKLISLANNCYSVNSVANILVIIVYCCCCCFEVIQVVSTFFLSTSS